MTIKIVAKTGLFSMEQRAEIEYQEGMTVAQALKKANMEDFSITAKLFDGNLKPMRIDDGVQDDTVIVIDLYKSNIW